MTTYTAASYRAAALFLESLPKPATAAIWSLRDEADRLDAERARKLMVGNRLADEVHDQQLLSDDELVALHDLAVTLVGDTVVDAEVVDEPEDPDEWRVLEDVPVVVKVHDRSGRLWEHHAVHGWMTADGLQVPRSEWNLHAPFTRYRFAPNKEMREQ